MVQMLWESSYNGCNVANVTLLVFGSVELIKNKR